MGATDKEVQAAVFEKARATGKSLRGLTFSRVYSDPSVSPYDAIEWELRTAAIMSEKGETIFEQKNVEVPRSWSQTATNIVVQKYFHGRLGTPERESSVRQLIERVAGTITSYGEKGGYFRTAADRDAFHDELATILVNQVASFNSPVWFNVGIEPRPQGSACFINSCGDSMASILGLAKTEGMLFKYGSGTGSNLSSIRGSHESLSAGGTASGPLSFMKGFDSFAGAIKSGGKTRRAAKMVILNIDHPDIEEFILSKSNEEKKAWALIDAGYDGSFNGEAYASIFFQNANHSIRVTDEFMEAVEKDGEWQTKEVLTGQPYKTYRARDLMAKIADSAWICGDPGMQYDTTINRWNPVKATHRINASNPCSRVHVRRRLGLQPGVFEPDEVLQRRGRLLRRRELPPRLRHRHHGAGDARRQLLLPDAGDRGELPRVPSARPRLREPRRAPDGGRRSRTTRTRAAPTPPRSRRSCAARPTSSPRRSPRSSGPSPATRPTARPSSRSSACTATRPTKCRRQGRSDRALQGAAAPSGTRPSSPARSTATRTARSRCSRPPARSAS